MKDAMQRISALVNDVTNAARRASWNLARTTPDAILRTAEARVDAMKRENEPFRRMGPAEHQRVIREIAAEETAARQLSASVARFQLEPKQRDLAEAYTAFVKACRRDVALTFPNALDRVDANGMLVAALLTETLRPTIANASPDDLLRRYQRSVQVRDARGRIEAELIEERLDYGGLAETPEDLPIIKRLREVVDFTQEVRVPYSIEEASAIEQAIAVGRKAVSLADVAHVRPVDANHPAHARAKQVFEAEASMYAEAISASGKQS